MLTLVVLWLTLGGLCAATGLALMGPAASLFPRSGDRFAFAVFLGLFIAGVSVTGGLYKLIPRWLMWLGMVVAAAGELSSLTLLNFEAGYFIPVARFVSIVWMIGISLKLPVSIKHEIDLMEPNAVLRPAAQ